MKIYIPAPGKRVQLPGNGGDWPADGRALDPLDLYQIRLVAHGDLIEKPDEAPAAKAVVTPAPAQSPKGEKK